MSAEEFVETAEQMADDPAASTKYRKILAQIMRDEENEYNRTKIQDRHGMLIQTNRKETCQLNKSRSPRILETLDGQSLVKRGNYLN